MTMEIQAQTTTLTPRREPWNKGKLIGAKPPLRPKHVWSIRSKLQIAGRTRDLAMFNLAIDSKLHNIAFARFCRKLEQPLPLPASMEACARRALLAPRSGSLRRAICKVIGTSGADLNFFRRWRLVPLTPVVMEQACNTPTGTVSQLASAVLRQSGTALAKYGPKVLRVAPRRHTSMGIEE
jgi:hypothetical protein